MQYKLAGANPALSVAMGGAPASDRAASREKTQQKVMAGRVANEPGGGVFDPRMDDTSPANPDASWPPSGEISNFRQHFNLPDNWTPTTDGEIFMYETMHGRDIPKGDYASFPDSQKANVPPYQPFNGSRQLQNQNWKGQNPEGEAMPAFDMSTGSWPPPNEVQQFRQKYGIEDPNWSPTTMDEVIAFEDEFGRKPSPDVLAAARNSGNEWRDDPRRMRE